MGRHGTGYIDQKHQVDRRTLITLKLIAFKPQAQENRLGVPGAGSGLGVQGKGSLVLLGHRIVIGEIIDHLLHPHRVPGRHAPLVQNAAHIGIGAGVHVNAEGGNRVLGHQLDWVLLDLLILFAFRGLLGGHLHLEPLRRDPGRGWWWWWWHRRGHRLGFGSHWPGRGRRRGLRAQGFRFSFRLIRAGPRGRFFRR